MFGLHECVFVEKDFDTDLPSLEKSLWAELCLETVNRVNHSSRYLPLS